MEFFVNPHLKLVTGPQVMSMDALRKRSRELDRAIKAHQAIKKEPKDGRVQLQNKK
jgi:hypothetical protein